jgi:hypothetical protein
VAARRIASSSAIPGPGFLEIESDIGAGQSVVKDSVLRHNEQAAAARQSVG